MRTAPLYFQFQRSRTQVLTVVLCVLFLLVTAEFGIAGTVVRVEQKNIELVDPGTSRVIATSLAPEAGFRSGQALLSSSQEAQCPAPSKDGTPGKPLELLEVKYEDKTVVTRWGGNPFFEIWLTFDQITDPECVRLRVAGKWVGKSMPNKGTGVEVWTKIPLQVAGGTIQEVQAFLREGWSCDFLNFSPKGRWVTKWGYDVFHLESTNKAMYMPAMSFSTHAKESVVAVIEPRSAFNVGVEDQQVWFSRKLFILPETGMVDENIDVKDGLPPAYHEIYIGSDNEKPGWRSLYWDYFLAIFPELAEAPAIALPSAMSGCVSGFRNRDKERWAKNLYSWGVRLTGFGHTTTYFTEKHLREMDKLDLPEIRKLGMSINIGADRYACDPVKQAAYGDSLESIKKELIWDNVKDSLITNSDGNPRGAWSGMAVNMSPQFSYSKRILDIFRQRLHDYNFNGAFIDYYFDRGVYDSTHSYGKYPFYPQLVSESWFMKELSDIVHSEGNYLYVNGPVPELISTNRLWDIVSGDVPYGVAITQKLQAVYKPSVFYGNSHIKGYWFTTEGWLRDAFRMLVYGCAISPWAFGPGGPDSGTHNTYYLKDVERGRPLFARNGHLMSRLAVSAMCDGDLAGMTWTAFSHLKGSRYLVAPNLTDNPLHKNIPLAGAKLKLGNGRYALIEWDLEQGGRVLAKNVEAEMLPRVWSVKLDPYENKLLCIEPMAEQGDIVSLDYFAHINEQLPWLKSATDQVLSAELVSSPYRLQGAQSKDYASFTIKGYAGVRFEAQFGYLPETKPGVISVVGAKEYAVEMKNGTIRVWGTQNANSTEVSFDKVGRGLTLVEGKTLRFTDAFANAPVAYDLVKGSQNDWIFDGGTWNLAEGVLSQSDISTNLATATLKMPLRGDYELTFRTFMQRDFNSMNRPEVRFVLGSLRGMDVYIAKHQGDAYPFYSFPNLWVGDKVVKRGLDLSIYPNQYQRYSRPYDWRIRKQGQFIVLSISYDNGSTYEDFLDWQSEDSFQPTFGISNQNGTLLVDRVLLKGTSDNCF